MNLDLLMESIEKAASAKATVTDKEPQDKPLVSAELEAVLSKEAAATNATRAFEDGEKVAREILEKLATEAISAAPAQEAAATEEKTEVKQETKEAPAEQVKVAAATEVKEEVKTDAVPATEEITTEENMNKEAQNAGKELATAILEKLAEGVVVSENSATASAPANKLQEKDQELVRQHDARIMSNPGRNGTISAMFDAIVQRAKGVSGAVSYDQVAAGSASAPSEGKDMAMGTGAAGPSPETIDKTAAVNALIEAGLEWNDAVDLVKAAAEEIEQEEVGQVKLAAVQELMTQGLDFDSAVEAVQTATKPE